MKKAILIVVIVLLAYIFLVADVYVKSMEQTEAHKMMGKEEPGKVKIKETWLGTDKFAQNSEDMSMIMDNSKQKVFLVMHLKKIYIEVPMDIDKDSLLQTLGPKAAEIISSIKISDVKADCDIGKKKVANWDCNGCEFEMTFSIPALNIIPKYKIRMWATTDVPFDHKKYTQGIEEFYKLFLSVFDIDEESQKELEKINAAKGFQVAAEITVNMFGSEIKIKEQVLEVTEKEAPPGIYLPPEDYTKKTIAEILGVAYEEMTS